MNKDTANRAVNALTARSLRAMAASSRRWTNIPEIPVNITAAEESKIKVAMLALADKLDKRYSEDPPIDGESNEQEG